MPARPRPLNFSLGQPRETHTVVSVTGFFLDCLGRCIAALPAALTAGFCNLAGDLIFFGMPRRRYALLSNLHHAFPDKPRQWHRRIARISCRRTVELGLYAFASATFSRQRIRRHFSMDETLQRELSHAVETYEAAVVMIPHFTLMESLTNLPALRDEPIMPVGVLFRPLNQPGLDAWVKRTRERFGMKLISRRDGSGAPMKVIEQGGLIGILFDQSAGDSGVMTTFMDRLVSATDLPGLIAQRYKTRVGILYTERTGFWRGVMRLEMLDCRPRSDQVVLTANHWLEKKLRSSDEACADWLWLHDRWRYQDDPLTRFRLAARREILEETLEFHGWQELPRKTRFWIRMPNWLGDVIMALPLLRALRHSRPDAELTLLVQAHFIPLLERLNIAERLLALPKKNQPGYYKTFKQWRHQYPDCHVLFTNSTRGDIEARCIRAPQRLGMIRPGKPRPFLTHAYNIPEEFILDNIHQTRLWECMFVYFGLRQELDLKPFALGVEKPSGRLHIGLISGTENDPSKRWPVGHWRKLIESLLSEKPEASITCYGTVRDTPITQEVVKGFPAERVTDMAGKTGLVEFAEALAQLDLLICNDTGGMHLANAIGTPVLVIFGPTNPVRTGPIFASPSAILQPAGCPATGGMPIDQVTPETVLKTANNMLA